MLLILDRTDLMIEQPFEHLKIVTLSVINILSLDGHLHILLLKPIPLPRSNLAPF